LILIKRDYELAPLLVRRPLLLPFPPTYSQSGRSQLLKEEEEELRS
jgi:hypothetical protein